MNAKRGEIWLTRLDPTEGNEIRKTRPCLIVSPDMMNRFLGTVIVIPFTSGSRPEPFRLTTHFKGITGLVLGDQIRSVSKKRLLKPMGMCDPTLLRQTLVMLREMFEE